MYAHFCSKNSQERAKRERRLCSVLQRRRIETNDSWSWRSGIHLDGSVTAKFQGPWKIGFVRSDLQGKSETGSHTGQVTVCSAGLRKLLNTKTQIDFDALFDWQPVHDHPHCVMLRASEAAAQCIVIGPVCDCVCWVCYHDNSKLRASILTKLGL